ncbi:MAG TPA: ABC transporter permease [Deltaproteobacteria bacterium]|nr:ABC transporter permease [Deltaproteobacteria bacterium]HPR56440.1 ABC transporter permease [Deltaproteobacteria bacterium]HXK48421.1 ABC transporter permease [Deltaproteobacteria bacterium]
MAGTPKAKERTPGAALSRAAVLPEIALSLVVVFGFTTLVLILAGAPPLASYGQIIKGSLGSWSKITHVIKVWIPLTLAASGLLYTFRIGLWNIGVEGQVMMGAILATAVLRMGAGAGNGQLYLSAALLAGMAGGAVWAILAGYLKTRGGVHEIFAGLGLNFVAQGLVLWLIFGPWKQPGIASMSGTETLAESLWMPYLQGLRISPAALGMTLTAIVLTAYMLGSTRFGLYLKAIGSNERAAFLFGLRPQAVMILAMVCAGGFAGLAGGFQVTGVYHRLIPAISSGYGYLALLVVMLANFNVWVTPLVAFFFACLNVGGIQLPMVLQLDSSLSGVIQGTLVIATLAVHALRTRMKKRGTA